MDARGRVLQDVQSATLVAGLFDGDPTLATGAELARAFAQLTESVRDSAIPVQIALPDPVVSIQTFEFESLPKNDKEREALVRWRFAKQLSVDGEKLACTWQELPESEGKHLLLAAAVDRRWLGLILAACQEAHLTPAVVDAGINFHFNAFQARFADNSDGALLVMQPDSWTAMLWDANRRPRFMRARWRNANGGSDHEDIAGEVERLIRAYVHGAPGRRLGSVAICGTEPEFNVLADLLDRRMHSPCVRLAMSTLYDVVEGEGQAIFQKSSAACASSLPR